MIRTILLKIVLPLFIIVIGAVVAKTLVDARPIAAKQSPPTPQPLVDSFIIQDGTTPVHVRGFGTIKAKRSISLVPQVNGVVVEKSLDFEAGGYCAEGQILLKIDDTDYILAFEKANAEVAQAELNLARAEEEADVSRQEWSRMGKGKMGNDGNSGQASALVLHEPQLKLAQAALKAAEAGRNQAQVNLSRCTLIAPFNGRVVSADVDKGQYLRAGNPVGVISATDIAEVTVSVADDELAWISVEGPSAAVTVGADFAGAKHQWEGRAVRLGGSVDPKNRQVSIVIEIQDPYATVGNRPPLVEGMFVDVQFSGLPAAGSVVIPRTALRPDNKVWLIDQDNNIRIIGVDVARAGVEEAVINGILKPGDRICTSNLQYVTDGMPVRLEASTGKDGA